MVINAIKKAFLDAEKRNWDTLYFFFDLHGTVLVADYDNTSVVYYPHAKEVLQLLTEHSVINNLKIVLCIYTCSHPEEIERYQKDFKENNIFFKYVNKNPEITNTRLGCYTEKPYFNLLLDDKCGFDPIEWLDIYQYFLDIINPKDESDDVTHEQYFGENINRVINAFSK